MSKSAAIIELGWLKDCFEAEDPCGIIRKVENVQDFGCLLRMGHMYEGKAGQRELSKLEAFLQKYYDGSLSMDDIKNLDIHLSIGDIVCHSIAQTEEEIESMLSSKKHSEQSE